MRRARLIQKKRGGGHPRRGGRREASTSASLPENSEAFREISALAEEDGYELLGIEGRVDDNGVLCVDADARHTAGMGTRDVWGLWRIQSPEEDELEDATLDTGMWLEDQVLALAGSGYTFEELHQGRLAFGAARKKRSGRGRGRKRAAMYQGERHVIDGWAAEYERSPNYEEGDEVTNVWANVDRMGNSSINARVNKASGEEVVYTPYFNQMAADTFPYEGYEDDEGNPDERTEAELIEENPDGFCDVMLGATEWHAEEWPEGFSTHYAGRGRPRKNRRRASERNYDPGAFRRDPNFQTDITHYDSGVADARAGEAPRGPEDFANEFQYEGYMQGYEDGEVMRQGSRGRKAAHGGGGEMRRARLVGKRGGRGARRKRAETLYEETTISPDASGSGEYETDYGGGEKWDFDYWMDAIHEEPGLSGVYELGVNRLPEGVEDIRGLIRDEPSRVFALVFDEGHVNYIGLNETREARRAKKPRLVLRRRGAAGETPDPYFDENIQTLLGFEDETDFIEGEPGDPPDMTPSSEDPLDMEHIEDVSESDAEPERPDREEVAREDAWAENGPEVEPADPPHEDERVTLTRKRRRAQRQDWRGSRSKQAAESLNYGDRVRVAEGEYAELEGHVDESGAAGGEAGSPVTDTHVRIALDGQDGEPYAGARPILPIASLELVSSTASRTASSAPQNAPENPVDYQRRMQEAAKLADLRLTAGLIPGERYWDEVFGLSEKHSAEELKARAEEDTRLIHASQAAAKSAGKVSSGNGSFKAASRRAPNMAALSGYSPEPMPTEREVDDVTAVFGG